MSNPKTLLEDLCEHALSCGAESIEVGYKDGREWVFARKGDIAFGTANFAGSSRDAKELRENLYAARKKPVRTAIGGQVWILKVGVYDSFGEDAFRVRIDPAPKLDPSVAPPFTKKRLYTTICKSAHSTRLSEKRRIRSWWLPSAAPSAAGRRDRGSRDHDAIGL